MIKNRDLAISISRLYGAISVYGDMLGIDADEIITDISGIHEFSENDDAAYTGMAIAFRVMTDEMTPDQILECLEF